jgi:hypothetical protein
MSRVFRPPSSAASPATGQARPSYSVLRGERDGLFWKHASSFTVRRAGPGDNNIVSLHFNHSGQLLQLGLLRRCLLRRCRRWRLRIRSLTTSAHDSRTNNGEDNYDGGCNPTFGLLTRRNDPGEKLTSLSPGAHTGLSSANTGRRLGRRPRASRLPPVMKGSPMTSLSHTII